MTRKVGNIVHIENESDRECSVCHASAECRPYGKNGALVCFECAMKDEAEANRQFGKLIGDHPLVIDLRQKPEADE